MRAPAAGAPAAAAPPAELTAEDVLVSIGSGELELTFPQRVALVALALSPLTPGMRARALREAEHELRGADGGPAGVASGQHDSSLADLATDASRDLAHALNALSREQRETPIDLLFCGLAPDATRHVRSFFAEVATAEVGSQCELVSRAGRRASADAEDDAWPSPAEARALAPPAPRMEQHGTRGFAPVAIHISES